MGKGGLRAAAATAAALLLATAVSAFASVAPPSASITVPAGTAGSTPATVSVPALPTKADIEIAIDTTGSMAPAIAQAQAEATGLVTAVQTAVPDSQFAVVDFKDANCDEPNTYVLRQAMTSSATDVQTAINAMSANGGCDTPEEYNLVFKNGYADATTGWRDGSRKFVIVIGDAMPHGANGTAFPACGDQSADPLGLDTATELSALAAASRTLMMVNAGPMLACYQQLTAGGFAGSQAVDIGADLASQIVALITSASSTVASVSMAVSTAPPGADASWISFAPPSAGPVTPPADVPFSVTATVPPATPAGTYTFDLVGLADGGDVGHMSLDVVVPPASGGNQPLTMTKTVDHGTAANGDTVTYTITIHNPNGGDVTLKRVTDTLPKGFRYVKGSTTGAGEPKTGNGHGHGDRRHSLDGHGHRHGHHGASNKLTWKGPLSVPAGGDLVITFQVKVGGHRGCSTDSATATAVSPYTVTGTGPTAPVCVTRRHHDHHHHGGGSGH